MKSLSDVRSGFLDFFAERGHTVVPSSPLVPRNDPTLLFTNAGMVQFKNLFTGAEKRPYSRATTVQKCVRAGGKHNDLDNVGYTARHHTFFEMLGNFSFGDYFKEEAITFAWDFVSKVVGPAQGSPAGHGLQHRRPGASAVEEDRRPFRRQDHRPSEQSLGHGPHGPLRLLLGNLLRPGRRASRAARPASPDEDGDRFLEFWNLVFMQFEQVDENTRLDLPKPSIDTGMGLERIAAILQGVTNNYDVDLFRHLIAASESASGVASTGEATFSHRIIADHLRATSFLIADGVLPSNEGPRLCAAPDHAPRHAPCASAGHQGSVDAPAGAGAGGGNGLGLSRTQAQRSPDRRDPEAGGNPLPRNLGARPQAAGRSQLGLKKGDRLQGEVAFKLYDTYGFPLDLTEESLRARGISVDTEGFSAAMQKQKAEARASWAGSGEAASEAQWFAVLDEVGRTEFLGYDTEEAEGADPGHLQGWRPGDGSPAPARRWKSSPTRRLSMANPAARPATPAISPRAKAKGQVTDTQKWLGALHVHVVRVTEGSFLPGDAVDLKVDPERRRATRANHSATHLLHAALKRVLGNHVSQKGSLVTAERLRFDFSHPKPVTPEELERIEAQVNAVVRQNSDTTTRLMPTDQAIAAGAEALFGEKYGDEVRVLSMGDDLDADKAYSVELCGGTHVHRLGDIGLFTILSESAVAAGVRRIEALTSEHARRYLTRPGGNRARGRLCHQDPDRRTGGARGAACPKSAASWNANWPKPRSSWRWRGPAQWAAMDGARPSPASRRCCGWSKASRPKTSRAWPTGQEAQSVPAWWRLSPAADGKASIVAGVTDDLTARISAVDLVRVAAEALGGKGGGGRPDMAQAGGPDNGNRAMLALDRDPQDSWASWRRSLDGRYAIISGSRPLLISVISSFS